MTPQELKAANSRLLERRKTDLIGKPAPISRVIPGAVPTPATQAESEHWKVIDSHVFGSGMHSLNVSHQKWEAFNDERHPMLPSIVKTVKDWYDDRLPDGGSIMLAGGYGCGKSHLAQAIKELYGWRALMWEETELCKAIQSSYNSGSNQQEGEIWRRILKADLFIFDDLGTYKTNNHAFLGNIYRQIFHGRCEKRKPVFFTTNLKMDELPSRIGGRNFSRLVGALKAKTYYVGMWGVPDHRMRRFV